MRCLRATVACVVACVVASATAILACGIDAVGTATFEAPSDGDRNGEASGESTVDVDASSDAPSDAPSDAATEEAGPPPVACPETGGVVAANHCYFPIAPMTQAQAKQACNTAGAHLVTVTSAAEHAVLATVGTGDRWIGLEAPMPTNTRAEYLWVTGEPSTVSYWYVNDPDNMGPCVALHGTLQEWVDRGCGDTNPAICERQ